MNTDYEPNLPSLMSSGSMSTGGHIRRFARTPQRTHAADVRGGFYTYVSDEGEITVTDGYVSWQYFGAEGYVAGATRFEQPGDVVTGLSDGDYVFLKYASLISGKDQQVTSSGLSGGSAHTHNVAGMQHRPTSTITFVKNASLEPEGGESGGISADIANQYYVLCQYHADNNTRTLIHPGGPIILPSSVSVVDNV